MAADDEEGGGGGWGGGLAWNRPASGEFFSRLDLMWVSGR